METNPYELDKNFNSYLFNKSLADPEADLVEFVVSQKRGKNAKYWQPTLYYYIINVLVDINEMHENIYKIQLFTQVFAITSFVMKTFVLSLNKQTKTKKKTNGTFKLVLSDFWACL